MLEALEALLEALNKMSEAGVAGGARRATGSWTRMQRRRQHVVVMAADAVGTHDGNPLYDYLNAWAEHSVV